MTCTDAPDISTEVSTPARPFVWRLVAAVLLTGATLGLAACNTVDGAGQDIEAAGENLSEAAD